MSDIKVAITAEAMDAVDQAAVLSGESHIDTINRAVQLYSACMQLGAAGGGSVEVDLFAWRRCKVTVVPTVRT